MKLKILVRYIIRFGLFSGTMTFVRVEWLKSERIRIRELNDPLKLRKNTSDFAVFREVFLFKSYNYYSPGVSVIIDGGGNIGLAGISFAVQYPHAKVYSIEPSASNFAVLVENTKAYSSIVPMRSALWNKDTFLRIGNTGADPWAYTVEECAANTPDSFEAISLTSLMKKYGIEQIDILKLDVEGAERELFTDNYDYWIRRTKYIWIELHDWIKPDCSKTVFKTLATYNFTTTILNGMLLLTNSEIEIE